MIIRVLHCLLVVTLGAGACVHTPSGAGRSIAPQRLLSDDERKATVAAAGQLFSLATEAVPVCVEFQDAVTRSAPDSAVLAALRPRARTRADCPHTYANMIYNPSAPTRPAGYIDPYRLVLWRPTPANGGTLVLAQLWQGTGYISYRCEVARIDGVRKAACRETGGGVS